MSTGGRPSGPPSGDDPFDDPFYEVEEPVGREAARTLFAATEGLLSRLDRVGNQILSSMRRPGSPGMTFLVSGPWGSGKSSALRYLQDYVADLAGGQGTPVFAWFRAPLYEGRSARAGLLLETFLEVDRTIAVGAAQAPVVRARDVLLRAMGVEPSPPRDDPAALPEEHFREIERLHLQRTLAKAVGDSIESGMIFEHWLPRYHREVARTRVSTVVFVDDLDRCDDPGYVRDVLVATNYWRHLTDHHVVIAADEGRIREFLGKAAMAGTAPDAGLGKYVHVTVHLPAVIEKPQAAAELFGRFVDRNALEPDLVKALHRHLQDAGTPDRGLLGPLLDPCDPRTLKQRFNALASGLGGAAEFGDEVMQHHVLEIRWPQAFREQVEAAELDADRVALARCRHLVELASVVRGNAPHADRASQEATLAELARRSGVALAASDAGLWLYLATSFPAWLGERPRAALGRDQQPESALSPALITSLRALPDSVVDADPTTEPPVVSDVASTRFTERLTALRTAAEIRDEQAMRGEFDDVVPALEDAETLPSYLAPILGNLALRFAAMEMPNHAIRLHICAVRADRDHTNVAQNFIDYVLDREVRQLYPACDEVLTQVEQSPTGHLWKPLRTRLLRMRLSIALGRPTDPDDLTELVDLAARPDSRFGPGELIDLLAAADELKRYDLVDPIGGALLLSEAGDVYEQTRSLRAIGDAAANSDEPRDEDFGATVYQFLLRTGLLRQLTDQHAAETMTNLATLLNRRGGGRTGWYLEWAAYRLHQSPELKLRLARAYNGAGDTETGRAMLEGRIAMPEVPPAAPPFPQPLSPPHARAEEFCARYFPDAPYAEPVLPELWEAP